MSQRTSASASEIPYFYLQTKDLEKTKELSKECELFKRVAVASIPFLCLYKPIGRTLTIAFDSTRAVICFVDLAALLSEAEKDTKKIAFALFRITISAAAIAGTVFKHPLGIAITTIHDILVNVKEIQEAINEKDTQKALENLFHLVNSSLYLTILLKGSSELIILSFLFQMTLESYQGYKELTKDDPRLIEGCSKLLLAGVRGCQAAPYVSKYYKENHAKIAMTRDKIAAFFHRCASLLAMPFWWYTEKAIRIFTPLHPGEADQCSTKTLEIAARIFYGALAFPMVPISLTLSAVEIVPRALANAIAFSPFTYLRGNAQDKTLPESRKITIFNMNLCFVAGGFPMPYAGVVPWHERIDPVVGAITDKNPDIICLQEVNDLKAADSLFDRLKDKYAHFYINIGPQTLTQNSGLFIASKYEILSPSFTPYKTGEGSQKMVNKGFFDFDVVSAHKIIAHIFTTHLSPSKDDLDPKEFEKQRRKVEIKMMFEKIRQIKERLKSAAILLVGDLNLPWGTSEYPTLQEHFHDAYNKDRESMQPQEATSLTDYMTQHIFASDEKRAELEPKRETYAQIMDYALLLKDKNEHQMQTELIPAFLGPDPAKYLSDHCGLFSTFILA